jgi:hypothetical protein
MPVSGSRIIASPAVMYSGVLLVIGADRQVLDADLSAEEDLLVNGCVLDHHRVDRMGLPRRAFLDERLDVAGLHAEREPEPLEARMHVGDQRDVRALDVLEDHQRESAVALQPLEDARDAELRIDFLRNPHHLFGMFLFEEGDEAAQVGRVGRVGQRRHESLRDGA